MVPCLEFNLSTNYGLKCTPSQPLACAQLFMAHIVSVVIAFEYCFSLISLDEATLCMIIQVLVMGRVNYDRTACTQGCQQN